MSLGILWDVEEIDGFKVVQMDKLRAKHPERFTETGAMDHKWFEETIRPNTFIYIREDKNSIAFTLQNGPIGDHGVNGCQVDTMIEAAAEILKRFNSGPHCNAYNVAAIASLETAVRHLKARRADRECRGVEGTNNV